MSGIEPGSLPKPMTGVRVERLPFGATSFSEATADVTVTDDLIVRSTDTSFTLKYGPLQVYRSGTWVEATVSDQHGNVLATILSKYGQGLRAARIANARERKSA